MALPAPMMRPDHPPPPRSLVWAMVIQYAAGGAFYPFVTLLLRDRGFTVAEISLVLLAGSAALLGSPFFWGMLADRFIPLNRLFAVMNGVALVALMAFWPQTRLAGVLVTLTVFFACYQPTPMLINALSYRHLANPYEQFAPLRAWGSFGWVVPSLPIFLWLVVDPSANFEIVVWLAAGLCLGMSGVSFTLPHTPPGSVRRTDPEAAQLGYWTALTRLLRNPSYLVLLGSYLLIAASFAIQAYYSPPRLVDLGLARAWIGPIQSIGVVWEIVLFRWRSIIVNRLGYSGSVIVGCLALAVRQLLFAYADNLWLLAASSLLVGTTVVLYHIGVSLLVEAIAGREVKSTAQTLLVLCSSGLGPMLANGAVAWLAPGVAPDLSRVFLFAAALAAGATLLVIARGRKLVPPRGVSPGN